AELEAVEDLVSLRLRRLTEHKPRRVPPFDGCGEELREECKWRVDNNFALGALDDALRLEDAPCATDVAGRARLVVNEPGRDLKELRELHGLIQRLHLDAVLRLHDEVL